MEISEVCETFHWKLSKVQLFLVRCVMALRCHSTEFDRRGFHHSEIAWQAETARERETAEVTAEESEKRFE